MFRPKSATAADPAPSTSLVFYSALRWLDGRPLLDTMAEYRCKLHTAALDEVGDDGLPRFSMVLSGRAKKNDKSSDIALAALFKLLVPRTVQGNDGYLIANDEDQACDDLDLIKKLIACNPRLKAALKTYKREIARKDGRGVLKILPARDVAGLHGKTGNFIGFDEVHAYRDHDLFEALAPDPTRTDVLTWITSYASIYSAPGIPLVDFFTIGRAGTDPRMLFSWYSGDYCTDPDFADLPPEQRANPSMSKWVRGEQYLEQQRRRLPSHKFRRLHLNLSGAPNGAFFDQGAILAAVVQGRRSLPPRRGLNYTATCDMSGGSSDNCVLCLSHPENGKAIVDLVEKQAGNSKPFDPMKAVDQFCSRLHEYGITTVWGDNFAGNIFTARFAEHGVTLRRITKDSASDQYEAFEPSLNASLVELLDDPTTIEEFLTLVLKGSKVTHESGSHDDHSNAVAMAANIVLKRLEKAGAAAPSTDRPEPVMLDDYQVEINELIAGYVGPVAADETQIYYAAFGFRHEHDRRGWVAIGHVADDFVKLDVLERAAGQADVTALCDRYDVPDSRLDLGPGANDRHAVSRLLIVAMGDRLRRAAPAPPAADMVEAMQHCGYTFDGRRNLFITGA